MSSAAIATVVKMMESLPIEVQESIVEHLREYIDELLESMPVLPLDTSPAEPCMPFSLHTALSLIGAVAPSPHHLTALDLECIS